MFYFHLMNSQYINKHQFYLYYYLSIAVELELQRHDADSLRFRADNTGIALLYLQDLEIINKPILCLLHEPNITWQKTQEIVPLLLFTVIKK